LEITHPPTTTVSTARTLPLSHFSSVSGPASLLLLLVPLLLLFPLLLLLCILRLSMRITTWVARCTPALSALLLLLLLALALLDLGPLYRFFRVAYTPPVTNEASYIQLIFAAYSIFVHLVALGFPIRVSFACWQLTEKIEEAHARLARDLPFKKLQPDLGRLSRIDEDADEKSEIRANIQSLVVHVIMIPCYKEDIENLKDTLRVLASHRDALDAYDVSPRIAFLLSSSQRLDTS